MVPGSWLAAVYCGASRSVVFAQYCYQRESRRASRDTETYRDGMASNDIDLYVLS
jgi:hypothetical protein